MQWFVSIPTFRYFSQQNGNFNSHINHLGSHLHRLREVPEASCKESLLCDSVINSRLQLSINFTAINSKLRYMDTVDSLFLSQFDQRIDWYRFLWTSATNNFCLQWKHFVHDESFDYVRLSNLHLFLIERLANIFIRAFWSTTHHLLTHVDICSKLLCCFVFRNKFFSRVMNCHRAATTARVEIA